MLFNSLPFVVFFPIIIFLYFTITDKYRWLLLLSASYYFYACWRVEYLGLIFISTVIDYTAAIQMSKQPTKKGRRKYLLLSLFSNLGLLFAFKYLSFLNNNLQALFDQFNFFYGIPAFEILLPVGISFYTFQTLSYTIDVYRGTTKAERHFGIFALYVSFFPQLVAGPIERSSRLLPQFKKPYTFDYNQVVSGLRLMLWGFFKKIVIADRLAILVNAVYNSPSEFQGITLIIATVFFAFQIFCDFSGYSDIAIGAARVMGYDLMKNFDRPYYSKNISEFWKRWHISLSTWFKDYLYIPLGGNRVVKWRWYYNLFITFLISGLWHGANWTFVIWGALHGFYLIFAIVSTNFRTKIATKVGLNNHPFIQKLWQAGTTLALVCFAWIFFRANSIADAFVVIHQSFMLTDAIGQLKTAIGLMGKIDFFWACWAIAVLEFVHWKARSKSIPELLGHSNTMIRWSIYFFFIFSIVYLGIFEKTEFIYFQF